MRLSTAMMLGSTTCKMVPADWNSCGLGCAANAVGIPEATPKTENRAKPNSSGRKVAPRPNYR